MSLIPICILIALACFAALFVIEPSFTRWLCAKALGWADAWEQFPKNRRESTQRWNVELGIADRPVLVRKERA